MEEVTIPKVVRNILRSCEKHCEEEVFLTSPKTVYEDQSKWTIVDLFIRQFINNTCDGFGLYNVYKVYYYLMKHKEVLIKYDLVSEEGYNNARFHLWKNYEFDKFLTEENDERRCNTTKRSQ